VAPLPGDGPAVQRDQVEAEAPGGGGVQADGAVVRGGVTRDESTFIQSPK